jgi:hypothetical protein
MSYVIYVLCSMAFMLYEAIACPNDYYQTSHSHRATSTYYYYSTASLGYLAFFIISTSTPNGGLRNVTTTMVMAMPKNAGGQANGRAVSFLTNLNT